MTHLYKVITASFAAFRTLSFWSSSSLIVRGMYCFPGKLGMLRTKDTRRDRTFYLSQPNTIENMSVPFFLTHFHSIAFQSATKKPHRLSSSRTLTPKPTPFQLLIQIRYHTRPLSPTFFRARLDCDDSKDFLEGGLGEVAGAFFGVCEAIEEGWEDGGEEGFEGVEWSRVGFCKGCYERREEGEGLGVEFLVR